MPHTEHLRSGVVFDVLRRWLSVSGHDVLFVRNVTDIDDKILRKATEHGRPWWVGGHPRALAEATKQPVPITVGGVDAV